MSDVDPRTGAALFDRHQLTLARQSSGLKKTELANRLELSAASVTQFENGDARPSPAVVARIALTLGFPVGFFTTAANKCGDDVGSTDAFFRSLRSTPLSERHRAVANARLFYRLSCALERHVDLPPVNIPTVPHCDLEADREQIELAASTVRAAWNVPDGPIGNMVRLLEAHGVLVTRSEFGS